MVGLVLALTAAAQADEVVLKNGNSVECVMMKTTESAVLVRIQTRTMSLPASFVEQVNIQKKQPLARTTHRIPNAEAILDRFVSQSWVDGIQDIPSTVIDVGVLKYVPYSSYKWGNYELNIYGDPSKPAAVEIGCYKDLAVDLQAKKNCLEAMAAILFSEGDAKILRSLKMDEDKTTDKDWIFEVAPPTAEDSYGGWWITVYNEKELDKARASDDEIAAITIKRAAIVSPKTKAIEGPRSQPDYSARLKDAQEGNWTRDDLANAREEKKREAEAPTAAGGRVYVRGYTRKDGTYVQPHTRKR
jgi:hypothetical protein